METAQAVLLLLIGFTAGTWAALVAFALGRTDWGVAVVDWAARVGEKRTPFKGRRK